MTIGILANCQGFAIKKILQRNFKNIEFLQIPLIFTVLNNDKQINIIYTQLLKADYILMQPLKSRFKSLSLENIKKSFPGKVISFPVLYFNYYHPEIIYLRDKNNIAIKSFEIDYHDINILHGYLNNKTPDELLLHRTSNKDFFDKDSHEQIWEESLNSLSMKEANCDVKITDFIRKEGKHKKLFHVVNHPTNDIINELMSNLIKLIDNTVTYKSIDSELLSNVIIPINPSVEFYMNNKLNDSQDFIIRDNKHSFIQMVQKYYHFYNSLDTEILKMNIYDTNSIIINLLINNNLNH